MRKAAIIRGLTLIFRPVSAIDRYVARQIFVPLTASLVIAAMLLVLDRMLRLFEFVADEGGPVSVVWQMLANLMPEYLSLGVPIGLLLGTMLAFRKLALSSELDVLQAVGQGYPRLLKVPFLFALALAAFNFALVGWIQPYSRYRYEGLRFELRSGALGASIKVGEFNRLSRAMTLRIERSEDGGRQLSDIFVSLRPPSGETIAVAAARGTFLATDDPDTIIFRLQNGALVHRAPQYKAPRTLNFSAYDLSIPLPPAEAFRGRGGRERERTIPELVRMGGDPQTAPQLRAESRAALHFRLVEVAMMLLLPMLGVALAVPPKRSSSALGIFIGLIMLIAYHKINEYAEGMGALGRVDPIIALWGPFLVFAALILWMFYVLAFIPGGQPLGLLEKPFAQMNRFLRRLFRRRREA